MRRVLAQVAPDRFHWTGAGGPFDYQLSPDVFVPTMTSELLADALVTTLGPADLVVDVGCGGGLLSVIAARLGARRVVAVDVSPEAVELTNRNAANAGVGDRVTALCGNALEPFLATGERADVVINDISGVPDAIAERLGWYPGRTGMAGDGIELPLRVIDALPAALEPERGRLIQPLGSIQFAPAMRRRLSSHFARCSMVACRHLFFPPDRWVAPFDDIDELRRQGRMRMWEARGRTWWELQVLVCDGLRTGTPGRDRGGDAAG